MLTATYTLVALSVEQAKVRVSLQSFQHHVRATLLQQSSLTIGQLEYACEMLNRLYQTCNWRKTEMYLIPAIRQATERADQLIEELNRLNQSALGEIRAMQARMGSLADGNQAQVGQICDSIDSFCAALLERLEKEEQELFAIARSAIGGDAWFAIANQFLLHDARLDEVRRGKPAPALAAARGAASDGLAGPDGGIAIPALAVLPLPGMDAEQTLPPLLRQLPERRRRQRVRAE
jgi:hemerythrin-like domain-containing protein